MRQLDDQERKIIRELIKDPRISDNQTAKNTKVPVMTVNRKRKALEESGLINYYCYLDTSRYGLETLPARQLYIIKFKIGITKKEFIEKIIKESEIKTFFTVHELESFIGEKDGQLIYALIIEGGKGNEIVEIFNGKLVPIMYKNFGNDCITETFSFRLTTQLRLLHNYLPLINIDKGKIKKDWSNDFMFID